jgi:hypothetical protein
MNDAFKEKLKTWVKLDNKIKMYNDEIKNLRKERESLTQEVTTIMKTNNLIEQKINTPDSRITFVEKTMHSSLSYAFLEKHLGEIVEPDNVAYIIDYLKSKRDTKQVYDLKRVYYTKKEKTLKESSGYETE